MRYLTETEFNNLYQDSRELEAMIVSFAKKISKDLQDLATCFLSYSATKKI